MPQGHAVSDATAVPSTSSASLRYTCSNQADSIATNVKVMIFAESCHLVQALARLGSACMLHVPTSASTTPTLAYKIEVKSLRPYSA